MTVFVTALFAACLALAARRAHRAVTSARRPWIIAASIAFGLALPAYLWMQAPVHNVVVLTAGASDAEIARAQRARDAFAADAGAARAASLVAVPDLAALRSRYPALENITVLGDGLASDRRNDPVALRLSSNANSQRARIEALRAPTQVAPGSGFALHGVVAPASDELRQVRLFDPANDEVASVNAGADGRFSLKAQARAAGQFAYRVDVLDASGAVVAERTVPIDVRVPAALRLLTLWGAPSFEARFLQDWARRGGASVLTRTRLGETIFRHESTGAIWPQDKRITATLLSNIDVVVADGRAFSALERDERTALDTVLARKRIGLVIVPPLPAPSDLPAIAGFIANDAEYAIALPASAATLIPAAGYWPGRDDNTVLNSQRDRTLARRLDRTGSNTVVSSVHGSHRWVTGGAPQSHATYWQTLFDAAVASTSSTAWLAPHSPIASAPFVACAPEGTGGAITYRTAGSDRVELPVFANAFGSRCVLTVTDSAWFELSALGEGAEPIAAQWRGAADRSHAQIAKVDGGAIRPDIAENVSGPMRPRPWLGVLALALASVLWWLERDAWSAAGRRTTA